MAMTKDEIREELRGCFSAYVTKNLRDGIILGGRLSVLEKEAALAKIGAEEFADLVREEMQKPMRRMEAQPAIHPVVPLVLVEGVGDETH
ncbi:hypothetical protein PXK01_16585 [Phaeobacter sp. PT47_59]|uniref:hypothetical protein n=1 Tax=Phaeobacter sp. PT47_59 TaxID=3029979 RepID=UPI0023801BC8|nr:hypothetical protein [Phaeobacter sp. PT47_59]MDE4175781.1 hypothetical protein [Phaeobacter sp. PT47_59]